jgi:hypothetical protein
MMHKKPNVWFILHVLFFIFAISSVFWLQWYWLALIFLFLRLQDVLFGGCILTRLEYGSWERRFTEDNIGSFLPGAMFKRLPFLIDWLFPAILILTSYLIDK